MVIFDGKDNGLADARAGTPLSPDAPPYLVRSPDEAKASQTILEPGALVRIRGSRGMGKTSLIKRLLQVATEAHCKTIRLSLNNISPAAFEDLNSFLREFSLRVGEALHIPDQLDDYWDDFFGVTICCKSYFEEYLLPQIASPIVLALDDVDRLFPLQNLADDFFGLLRAWHEDAKTRAVWRQLRLIVAHSTDLYVPQNINKSPFNVGLPLDLVPLTPEQVQTLVEGWQISLSPDDVLALTLFVGGRPQLAQLACQGLSQNGGDLALLIQTALTPDSPFALPLQRLHQALEAQPELQTTLTALTAGATLDALPAAALYRLDSLGLVTTAHQQGKFSCELYAEWVKSQ